MNDNVTPMFKPYTAEDAYADWLRDEMESHGKKAAFMAGYRAALEIVRAENV